MYTGAGARIDDVLSSAVATGNHRHHHNKVTFDREAPSSAKTDKTVRSEYSVANSSLRSNKNNSASSTSSQIRKPLFKYCYNCSRSVGVRLKSCTRCHQVYYCSRACKLAAWEHFHRDECRRIKKARALSPLPSREEQAELFRERPLAEVMDRAGRRASTIVDEILDRHLVLNELNKITLSRHGGLSLLTRNRIDPNLFIKDRRTAVSPSAAASNSGERRAPGSAETRTVKDDVPLPSKSASGRHQGKPVKRNISGCRRRPDAHVSDRRSARERIGRKVEWYTDGTTLKYLDITENYSYV